ncbi:MAG: dienelactone hydrolase family protein [Ferruginibacter sp.]
MKKLFNPLLCAAILVGFTACNNNSTSQQKDNMTTLPATPIITGEAVSYNAGSLTMNGFVAYDSASASKRPVVLVIPEWWGLTDYAKSRAKQLAELGYLAMAVDMYGNGAIAGDPGTAQKLAGPFYADVQIGKERIDAALAKIKTYPQADTNSIAAIGYCFGGAQVLNAARLGENFKGVVSFHGNLVGAPADKNLLKAKILVCHGEADQFVTKEEVAKFKKQMDSIGAVYTFKSYANATHAFTNPAATETGKKFSMPIEYNAAADTASWNDMKIFFAQVFK